MKQTYYMQIFQLSKTELLQGTRYEVFMVVKIQVEVFWVVMLHSVVVGYQYFRGPSSELRQHGPLKHRYPTTTLHGITTQKSLT
jgi:hypothetical protein